jgi:hypothetical protein
VDDPDRRERAEWRLVRDRFFDTASRASLFESPSFLPSGGRTPDYEYEISATCGWRMACRGNLPAVWHFPA